MSIQQAAQENLAAMVANLLSQAYGSPEAAAAAIQASLDNGDLSTVRAGVATASQKMQAMGEAALAQPEQFASAVAGRMGEYKPTSVDQRRAEADIVVQYCNGGSFTIKVQNEAVDLGGKRGIRQYFDNGSVEVTDHKLEQLRKKYTVETSF